MSPDVIALLIILGGIVLVGAITTATVLLTRPRTPYQIGRGGRHPYDRWM